MQQPTRLLIVAFLLVGSMMLWPADARAQIDPRIFAEPPAAAAGISVKLSGDGFTPGSFEGLLFWDDDPYDVVKISDGTISTGLLIPPWADLGLHTIRVCLAFRNGAGALACYTDEFAEEARTEFEVTAEVPIRICKGSVEDCTPFVEATLTNITTGDQPALDSEGLVAERNKVRSSDLLWATVPDAATNEYTVYFTSGDPVPVSALYFAPRDRELRLAVTPDQPLLLHDLNVSAEWYVEGTPADAERLARDVDKASAYLYDFTEGQMALRNVIVHQALDNWDGVEMQLYASNTLRPNAVIGGIVPTYTHDLDALVDVVYEPGVVSMGSQWNRYGVPPGQPVPIDGVTLDTATLTDDWSMALAHELGHFLLFLFDTYRDAAGNDSLAVAAQCFGSAMGDVYRPENHAFIADQADWRARCGNTEAFAKQAGRTEWATIVGRYSWLIAPAGPAQVDQLPLDLTNLIFVAPSEPQSAAFDINVMALAYQDGESSSGEARAFTFRNERIYAQGKPLKGVNQVALTGAQVGDQLCVYDVNDYTEESGDAPRHQFGCETLQTGDGAMDMTKESGWRPVVTLQQVATDTLRMTVTQQLPVQFADALTVRIYPEHKSGLAPVAVPLLGGEDFGRDIVLPGPVPPLYVQLYVGESPSGLATRRETVLDRGVGGGGLFGPISKFGGVLIYSSDGEATFQKDGDLTLTAGQSIAWQTMVGTPVLPADKQITGQAYRLDAFPPELVDNGVISIEYDDLAAVQSASSGALGAPAIHFFDGAAWSPLVTTRFTPTDRADGVQVANAESRGVGLYAVLYDADVTQTWLPFLIAP